jgi:hypothetical protein
MKLKLYILLLLLSTSLFAQKVTTSIDTTKNKIGAEFKLTIKADVDTLSKVVFPKIKNIGALEVIQSYSIDTIKKGNRYELIKKYGLTQFDSGKYAIPRLPILINGKPVFSDSLKVEVNDVKVDTLKQRMYDIKNIASAESDSNWWKYVLGLLLIVGIAAAIYWYYKKYQKREKPVEIIFTSPIEKATSLLQQLETKKLWQKGEIKSYYSELTDIARNYIEEEIKIPAMESTTSELIVSLRKVASQKKLKLSKETLANLEMVLQQADLVKFAKSKPQEFEIEEDKKRISSCIVTIHNSIPVIVETNDELEQWNEEQKEIARLRKLKKQKQKRIVNAVALAALLIASTIGILIATKGLDFVKDNLLGNPTKELAEGEWIYSEYGNPGVKIETPKVLKRIDAAKVMPKNKIALYKEMQLFAYGNMSDDFYVLVSTLKYKKDTEIDLQKAIDGTIESFEQEGAANIIVKSEDFDTQKGVTGKKAYGTLTSFDKAKTKSQKMYYEVALFAQDGGLQQIIIMHKEEDKYGKQVMERVLNSVELKQAEQ